MAEIDLFEQIEAHHNMVSRTYKTLLITSYFLRNIEKNRTGISVGPWLNALRTQFEVLSLDEYEQFMILNPPYWSLYQQLFARYRNLNQEKEQSN